MSNRTKVADLHSRQEWPKPTDDQVSLIARILGPHVQQARAERLAAEQATRTATGRAAA
ncbi:hypothetical protein OHV05_15275 [Kitasatospora sp. NBC_00070]|uniref:hypothetical protein n=1 Tax=Kitasatospora sp. NBC_00070 TaxID=2975962 RepID=UPI0032526763